MRGLILISLLGFVMSADWNYANYGRDMWTKDFQGCGGNRQSPIDIPDADSSLLKYADLGQLSFNGYDNMQSVNLTIMNNGHTAVVNIHDNQKTTFIQGGGLPAGKYVALQFHFHWGPNDTHGSEHTLREKKFPLELHIVHYKDSYPSVSDAVSSEKGDGLAVVGIFFDITPNDNPKLNPIIDSLARIQNKDGETSVNVNFAELFGEKTSEFYRYLGSLTTPGCNEAVIWTVLEGRNSISSAQLAKFRDLRENSAGDPLTFNYRHVQLLHNRQVTKNFQGDLPADYHWSYGQDFEGPQDWPTYYPTCRGQRQSPINIPPLYHKRIADFDEDLSLDSLEFVNYDKMVTGMIKNNGHTVQVDITNPDIYIRHGGLKGEYRAFQFHFHWGRDDHHGSEHVVNDVAFPLELHIVHYNMRYNTITDALGKGDGLAVVGFLFEVSVSKNDNYDSILTKLNSVKFKDETTSITGDFTLEHLTLNNLKQNASSGIHYPFYRYEGGLTTPPCSEVVIWTVMNTPIHLSAAQINQFRGLTHIKPTASPVIDHDLIGENYRPVQHLMYRHVFISSPGLVGQAGTSHPTGFHWSYHGDSGPQNWKYYYPTCEGNRQSPINIPGPQSAELVYDENMGLRDLEFINYDKAVTGMIKNNGHTIQVDITSPNMYIQKGGLTGKYRAVQFHFHWGPDNNHGSEHTVNSKAYPLEMHIVHFAERYGSVSEAVKQQDGLAVVGFLFGASSVNTNYSGIISSLLDVKYKGASKDITGFTLESLTLNKLRKDDMDDFHYPFYRYMGGLTTPPCSQVVIWTVMQTTIGISTSQLAEFRKVLHVTEPESNMATGNVQITDNYRPVQDLYTRKVYTSYPVGSEVSAAPRLNFNICYLTVILVFLKFFR